MKSHVADRSTNKSLGHVIVGTVMSTGAMSKLHEAVFPASSTAVTVIVVVPETIEPTEGLCVMNSVLSQLSEIVAKPVTSATVNPQSAVALMV